MEQAATFSDEDRLMQACGITPGRRNRRREQLREFNADEPLCFTRRMAVGLCGLIAVAHYYAYKKKPSRQALQALVPHRTFLIDLRRVVRDAVIPLGL